MVEMQYSAAELEILDAEYHADNDHGEDDPPPEEIQALEAWFRRKGRPVTAARMPQTRPAAPVMRVRRAARSPRRARVARRVRVAASATGDPAPAPEPRQPALPADGGVP